MPHAPRAFRRRPAALATAAVFALSLSLIPALTAPATASPGDAGGSATPPAPLLTPATFADPPTAVRPMYRYWMPLAYTEDEVLREELRDMAAAGAGGVEIAPFVVPGAGNQTNAFLAEYGWGTPAWAHKIEVITDEAAKLGLSVDQSLGPQYPPTVPSLNSFNQPEVEQQLVFGREFHEPGDSRSGALPAPTTTIPSVSTQLCGPATAGDQLLRVRTVGGFATGDVITVGAGATAEQVTVSSIGDRLAECADLGVSELSSAHAIDETVRNVAHTTRLRTLVAQCADACATGGAGSVLLDPGSVVDVTDDVVDGELAYAFAAGNGNPWVLIDFVQAPSALIAQRGGYTPTQPNYVVDHLSRGGVEIQADFWDEHILTDAVRANLARIGRGAVFEDSLELGTAQKWTWDFLDEFEERRGYDPTLVLPALAGAGIQGTGAPAFEFAEIGEQVREDYRQTMSDLFVDEYVTPMQEWAAGHGLDFRVQPYGIPISSAAAAAAAGIAEGESLNFGSPNALGAEQDYRVLSGGAHLSGKDLVSTECCAVFQGGYRSSAAGPNVGGQFGEGGDGTQVGGRYSQGLLDSINKAYAGGVNQVVWHGYAYRDAPKGVGTSGRDGGTWPGYQPWDIFGVISVNDVFGQRQASWADYAEINDSLARTQLVLRQGRATVDLGVYYEDLGLIGSSVSDQQPRQHMLGTDSATSSAGYTYEYVAPDLLEDPTLEADGDGGLFGDRSDFEAIVLNDQATIGLGSAERLLTLAEQGLRIFVVGDQPTATTGAEPEADRLADVVAALLAEPTVVEVADEASLPDALDAAGIRPTATPEHATSALGLVRREARGITYDFAYNRSGEEIVENLTLAGNGRPFLLDTWTGAISPIAEYSAGDGIVTVPVRIAPYDKVIVALSTTGAISGKGGDPVQAPALHAVRSDGDVSATGAGKRLVLRASQNGEFETELSDGTRRVTVVEGLTDAVRLDDWNLLAQTWGPGANAYTTAKVDQAAFDLTTDGDGRLASWRSITAPVDLSRASGIGTYTTTFDLPSAWTEPDGAYLDLGDVLDTAQVTVNGVQVTVNQSDRSRIDLGTALQAGENTLTVQVATTMFNAVRATGDSNYQLVDWQHAGLRGPIVLTPYRDVVLPKKAGR
ncbi:hypothetical protein GCM10017608_07230 [Agromyces luteolus]|uniref:Beta-mannosidase-like galactose-binding domain-containing protein n=1 Tax=Agromyces luteolus TaxID=88373 RepID=A0A7C9LZK2_9MICO|nr:glycosyl hydrolase [Agromyces luteolus]MUN08257.1 hypothetical protein [Agromyces luteolus]GLK26790.1 hypothetical protein GCM10017608_07230 [Agromyces luteolus]